MYNDHKALLLAGMSVLALSQFVVRQRAEAAPLERLAGVVAAVERSDLLIEDKPFAVPVRIAVSQNTKIMRNGKLARLRDIAVNDWVEVTHRPLGDKLLALTINAQAPQQ